MQTRLRAGVSMGKRNSTVRVMFKALTGGSMQEYLALVERDRPDPANTASSLIQSMKTGE